MKKPLKAALLSAFVFPGIGHFLSKKYLAGTILAGTALAGLYVLIAQAVQSALQVIEKIESSAVPLDAAAITELVTKQTSSGEARLANIATAVLIIAWLIGIVDSYRVARAKDRHVDAGG